MRARHFHKRGKDHPSRALIAVGVVSGLIVTAVAAVLAVVLITYDSQANAMQPPEDLSINQPYDGAKIYDRNGVLLYEFVDENHGLRRPVTLADISPYVIAATVATEDSSFFENSGVNLKGLARAAWENISPFASGDEVFQGSGGSSITQQLVKNVYIPADERADRSISRKIKETVYALEITKRYSKDQILEWYLNQINYGGIYYGIEAASQGYFGKPSKDLTLAEAALLAGIPQSPAALNPEANPDASVARRNEVLELIRAHQGIALLNGQTLAISNDEINAAEQEPLVLQPPGISMRAPHFIFSQVEPQLEAMYGKDGLYADGLQVTTTIDINLQDQSQVPLENWIEEFENSSNSRNGAAIIIAPNTGEIWAYIGSRDYGRDDIQGQNDNLTALNSPGSTFKPFVYLTSFLKLGWSPGTVIVDEPTTFKEADGSTFSPENPNHKYNGRISLRDSLGNSLNIPAFKTAAAVGIPTIVDTAKSFGFTTLNGNYGPSISVGGVDLTALDLAFGYSVLANGGMMRGVEPIIQGGQRDIDPVSILTVADRDGNVIYDANQHRKERQVVDPEHAYMITSILTDPSAECITFGCGGIQIKARQVAVKTGTSEPFDPKGPDAGKIGDTWAFGYTPDMVVGVWAGNSDNSPITNILSTSISYRAMRDILLQAYGSWQGNNFVRPPGLVDSSSCSTASIAVGCKRDLVLKSDADQRGDRPTAAQEAGDNPDKNNDGIVDKNEQQQQTQQTNNEGSNDRNPNQGSGPVAAAITSPNGGDANGTVVIRGTAAGAGFAGYSLDFRPASGGGWYSLGSWAAPVTNGTLGAWATNGLPAGDYVIRLTVLDSSGGSKTSTVSVTVK